MQHLHALNTPVMDIDGIMNCNRIMQSHSVILRQPQRINHRYCIRDGHCVHYSRRVMHRVWNIYIDSVMDKGCIMN